MRARLAVLLGLVLSLGGLQAITGTVSADAAGTGLVISEVYVNGGSAGATYKSKFVELYNPGTTAIDLTGRSVQYRPAGNSGNSSNVAALTGTIDAKGYYVVVGDANGGSTPAGAPVPASPGQTSTTINPAAGGGTLSLVTGTTAVDPSTSTEVIDKIGYGDSNTPEGGASGTGPTGNSVTKALSRVAAGTDTDVNSADFSAQNPSPGAAPTAAPPPPAGGTFTIAQIQGTTDTSPYNGSTGVTTTGVVTAAYPTGGLSGFYLQTGGNPDTAGASDGLFVYAGSKLTPGQYPTPGATYTVTGDVTEYFGLTELNLADSASLVKTTPAQAAVVPLTSVPGTDCAVGSCLTGAALDAAREQHEGELVAPTGAYTVTDAYDGSPYPSTSSSNFGEIALAANSTTALFAPTELWDSQTQAAQIAAQTTYNDAHRVILDDGSSTNYNTESYSRLPWLTKNHTVRDGAAVTFPRPVVLTYANSSWKVEPSGGQVIGDSTGDVDFAQNRTPAPENVGGDVRLATFNVLNYFPTTGQDYVASGKGSCTYYNDRQGNPITDNTCGTTSSPGPRGAATTASFQRQQAKIVHAINKLGASIVSLEEIENSVWFGKDRDSGVSNLVQALNAQAGAGTWAYAPSPSAANLPPLAEQDVIRTAFIYKPAAIDLVGASKVLTGSTVFSNAREPLAQGFTKHGAPASDAFTVVVNHLKSKGSCDSSDPDTGQGACNKARVAQADAARAFAASYSAALGGTGAIFMTGDYNAYSQEDPVQAIEAGGYTNLESTTDPSETSYNFSGQSGSLDHVFANPAAKAMVTGVDIWGINAEEPVYYEYSRYNYNVTDLYDDSPYRASDHNPEVVGLKLPSASTPGPLATEISAVAVPRKVRPGRHPHVVFVVQGPLLVPADGVVRVKVKGHKARLVALTGGFGVVKLPRTRHPEKVTLTYLGNERYLPSSTTVKIKIRR